MSVLDFLQYTATILGISGAVFVAFKKKSGFIIWLVGNALWVLFGIKTNQWGLALQFTIFWFISLIGLINWSKKEK